MDDGKVGSEFVPESGHRARERLELALEGAALGTWDWNIVTGETTFNSRWAEMLGYQLNGLESNLQVWQTRLHPDDQSGVRDSVQSHLNRETPVYQSEYRLPHRNGKWIWVLAHGRIYDRAPDGTPLRAAGIHQDITQRKESEEALLLSREMYKNTVELTTQIPWTAAADGSIISCDVVWESYTRTSLETSSSFPATGSIAYSKTLTTL